MKMHGNVVVALMLLASMVAVWAWDIYAAFALPPGESVSWVLQEWCRQWPILPLFFGILVGHLMWPKVAMNGHGEAQAPQREMLAVSPPSRLSGPGMRASEIPPLVDPTSHQ